MSPTTHTRNGSVREWRALRAQVLARDRWTCRRCGAPTNNVDYIRPLSEGGSDQPGNMRAVCVDCGPGTDDGARAAA